MHDYNPQVQRELADAPQLPLGAAHVWEMFHELDVTRTSSGFGMNPLGFEALHAYEIMTRYPLSLAEIALLRALDMARLEHFGKQVKAKDANKKQDLGAATTPPLPPDTGTA